MRLRCLKLIRYGHFTDFSLDFRERSQDGSDFHIIFGENEAGKSTAINGFFELLFGIHNQSKYGFHHTYDNLRVGAIIELNNKAVELSRIKGRRDTLRDAEDKPISEDILNSALYGLSGSSYPTMFCLNEETLERGGEEILASKGDVGRLLFTGTAGLSDLSKVLEKLQGQANQVYKEGRSSNEISLLKQQLDQLDDKRKKMDTQVGTYRQLESVLQRADEAYKQARKTRDDIRKNYSYLKSLKTTFPIRTALLKLEKELEDIPDFPDLPVGWVEEIIRLQQEKDTSEKDQEAAKDNINTIEQQLANLKTDPIVKKQENFKAVELLKVRAEAADEELHQLCADLLDIETDLDEIQQKLGVDKHSKLDEFIIPEDTISYLEELLHEEISLKQISKNAEHEFSHAKDCLQQSLKKKESFPIPNEKVLELNALFNSYKDKKEDPQHRINNAKKVLSQKILNIDEEFKNLAPWRGLIQEIKDLEFPTIVQAESWSERAKELKQKLKDRKQEQERHKRDHALFMVTIKSQSDCSIEISDANAKKSREEREKAWREHRNRLDITSADTFEKVLINDDNIRDKRLAATDQLSRLRGSEESCAKTEGSIEIIADEIRRIEKELGALKNEMQPALSRAKLPDDFEAEYLREWLKGLQRTRKLVEEEEECRNELNQVENEVDSQRIVLLQALKKIDAEQSEILDLAELRAITSAYLDRTNKEKRLHEDAEKELSRLENETQQRNKAVEIAVSHLEEWNNKWNQVLEQFWLKGKSAVQARALLGLFKDLGSKLASQKKLYQKINEKEADKKKFFISVTNLVCSLEMIEQDDKIVHFLDLQEKLKKAQQIEKDRFSADKDMEQARKQFEKSDRDLCRIEKRAQEMAAYFAIPEKEVTLDRLAIILKQAQKKNEIVNFISEKELSLFYHLGVDNRVDADEKFDNITLSDVEEKLTEIEGALQEIEKNLENRVEERRDARHNIEKIGGDASIALLNEERQSILLEISKKTNRALALHLGLMASEHALSTYRDHHRSELLMQTADAFKAITSGTFSSLSTQSDQAGDRLIAVRSNGRSISAESMSKGTRYQLYLALRLAAYHRFCNEAGALPFIGDDIMETFDDRRSESAIHQLSKIAKHGQVLYFTHHRHLCDIAKRVCGDGVMIHEIPKPTKI